MYRFAAIASAIMIGIMAAALSWASGEGLKLKLKTGTIDTGTRAQNSQGIRGGTPKGGNFYIIQFDGPIREEWKDALRKEGVRLYSYIPEYAFLAKLDPDKNSSIIFKPHVSYVGEYKPEYRVAPHLERKIKQKYNTVSSLASSESVLELWVKVFDGEPLKPITAKIRELNGKVQVLSSGEGLNEKLLKVEIPFYMAAGIAGIPGVEWVESSPRARLCMDQARDIVAVNVANNFPKPLDGRGEMLGLCDSGLDTGDRTTVHKAFRGRIAGAMSYRSDKSWRDEYNHGTYVAGVMAGGDYAPGYFLSPYQGVAPGARLYVQSIQNFADYFTTPPLDTVVFLNAFRAGVRVHNNSWVTLFGEAGEYDLQCVQADTFTWKRKDFLPVFVASGRSHSKDKFNNYSTKDPGKTLPDGVPDLGTIPPPGTAKNVISVGGTHTKKAGKIYKDPDLGFDNLSTFFHKSPILDMPVGGAGLDEEVSAMSGRGPTGDGRIKPDLVAPATVLQTVYSSFPNFPLDGDGEYGYAGESVSAPMVAGGAAIVRQYLKNFRGVGKPSAALVKAILINGGRDIGLGGPTSNLRPVKRPDYHQGWGRLDVMGAIYPGQPDGNPATPHTGAFLAFTEHNKGIKTDDGASYTFRVADASVPVRVTLVWTDYPAAAGASEQLVNDLNLTVIAPDGWWYTAKDIGMEDPNRPWYQDPEEKLYDHTNNVESVEFYPGTTGYFYVNVQGANIPNPPQHFAVAVTGGLDMSNKPDGSLYFISGRAVDSTGAAYPGVAVVATGPVIAAATTGLNGEYSLTGLVPGTYYLDVYDFYPGGTLRSIKPNKKVTIKNFDKSGLVLKGNPPPP